MSPILSPTGKFRARALATIMLGLVTSLACSASVYADSTVYRCGPKGSQWYSQIPCTENSEQLVVKEQHKLSDADTVQQDGMASGDDPDSAPPDPASNAQSFIDQLEKQRKQQLAELDRNIAELRQQMAATEAEGGNEQASREITVLLANLQTTRESVVSEYDAMISAAQQRIAKP